MTRLDTNLAVFAGAGTGKTHALMTMCLHVLAGIRAGRLADPLPASQLTLLTFTDKAAAQLRARLRERVQRLCEGEADEPDLRHSFETLGQPMPGPVYWKEVRSQLANADIGTFHALCLRLLKGAPAGRGVTPAIEVLDERASDGLLRATVEKWVIAGLERREAWLGDLVRGLEYPGVVEGLLEVYRKAREDGVPFAQMTVGDAEASRREFESRRVALRHDLIAEKAVLKPATKTTKGEQRFSPHFDDAIRLLEGGAPETFCDRVVPFMNLKGPVVSRLRERLQDLAAVAMAAQLAPYEAHLREALTHIGHDYQRALQQVQAIDFTDIMVKCRDLLRDDAPFREAAQRDIGTLLVDEFQDTNRVQLDVVRLLAAKRDGAGSLEPAFLAVVGDRKQSIYDFRGADVAVFETMAQAIESAHGRRAFLKTSRRASPGLVAVFNKTFPALLGPVDAPRGYDVVYQPEHDDMLAYRKQQLQTPAVVRLSSAKFDAAAGETRDAKARRASEAEGLARYLSHLISDGVERVVDEHTQAPRPARAGDVAMLFRSFSQVEVYRQALVRHRVRHTVVRGRGFYAAPEVVDVASWLKLLADPRDSVALAAVLRSPWVGLSDTSLLCAAEACGGRLDTHRLLSPEVRHALTTALTPAEAEQLERLADVYGRYRVPRTGLAALLEGSLTELGFSTAVAAAPFGEQALLNLQTVLSLAQAADESGRQGLAEMADTLRRAAEGEGEDPRDDGAHFAALDAVSLMTVHQSKGLEWPIVVLPDLCTTPGHQSKKLVFDRDCGLALKPWTHQWEQLKSTRYEAVDHERTRREEAQAKRLLYVAMTRAKDQLVLGPMPSKADGGAWAGPLSAALSDSSLARYVDVSVQLDTLAPGAAEPAPPAQPVSEAAVSAALARAHHATPVHFASALLSVSQLGDFEACPKRYCLTHVVGLNDDTPDTPWEARGALSPEEARRQGTTVHQVLERVDWQKVTKNDVSAAVREAARVAEGETPPSWLEWVEQFLQAPLGQALAARGEAHVFRELPFFVALQKPGQAFTLHLRGQLDLAWWRPDGTVQVLDYKTELPPAHAETAHAFQLDAYLLAAKRLFPQAKGYEAGIVYLREPAAKVPSRQAPGPEREAQLVDLAQSLLTAQASDSWAERPRAQCEQMSCPHILRCHGAKTRL
ncbi:MAG: UvrD-helicase domain-containing protein [Myxococcaceae bacterium]|nr:UvrD-helicase domain-containing protein [Myxococcaceae bacterium]